MNKLAWGGKEITFDSPVMASVGSDNMVICDCSDSKLVVTFQVLCAAFVG